MAQHNDVAMTVIDPGNQRWAQLLDPEWQVTDLLALLVERLDLPADLDYQLIHVDSGRRLAGNKTLASYDVQAGAVLQVGPVRNKLLADLLEKLYDEAIGYAAEQLWAEAEQRLEAIRRLDPIYPDPQGVAAAIAAGRAAGTSATTASRAQSTRTAPAPGSAAKSGGAASPRPTPPTPAAATPTTPSGAQPARAGRGGGCTVTTILVLAAVVALAYWGVTTLLDEADSFSPGDLPFIGDLFGQSGQGTISVPGEPQLGTGDVQVTLRWDNAADVDLAVIDPFGEKISYQDKSSASGGLLDVDAHIGCSAGAPVENIYWPLGQAPLGAYDVQVVYYEACDTAAVNYVVTVTVDGVVVDERQGTLNRPGEEHQIGRYTR